MLLNYDNEELNKKALKILKNMKILKNIDFRPDNLRKYPSPH